MKNQVTVLIPSYNSGKYLKKAFKSVFQQTYQDWKIILIDDASTDNSISSIKEYLKDPRVTLVSNKTNVGQSKSMNIGLALVDTPYIIQLDADDCFYPNTLEILVTEAEKQPEEVGVLYGNFITVWEDKRGNRIKERIHKGRLYKDGYDFLYADCTVRPRFYRTSALREVGGWPTDDPDKGRYVEDRRILLRMIENYRFHWVDELLYVYRKHDSNMTNDSNTTAKMIEWIVRDALKRWGDKYEPVFTRGKGWVKLLNLIPKAQCVGDKRIGLSYADMIPKPGETGKKVYGGRVKLRHLDEFFPEQKFEFNVLYLVSSYLPNYTKEWIKICKKEGVKVVWNQDGVAFPAWAGKDYKKQNAYMGKLMQKADYVIYQSQFSKNSADKFLGPFKGPASIVYNCVDANTFSPIANPSPLSPIKLLVMGTHYDRERVTLAIQTLEILRKQKIPAKLTIGGTMKWNNAIKEVEQLISSLGLKEHVTILGSYVQEEAPAIYQSAHILLHLKYKDPCPTVPMEAMACGLPVIASRSGGMKEVVGKKAGVLIEVPKSWEKLYYPTAQEVADAVEDISKNWKMYSEEARKRAVQRFDKESWLEEHQKIFQNVIKE